MVIGFDGSRAFISDRTGTENYSYQLLKALAKVDKKNKYLVYLRSGIVVSNYSSVIPSGARNLPPSLTIRPRKIASSKTPRNDDGEWPKNFQFKILNWPGLWTQAGLAIRTFIDPLDVLFVPSHTIPIIHKPGLKTVVTVHDLGSEYLPSAHQIKQRLYLGFMQKFQLKTANKIIAVSKATKEDLVKKLGLKPEKIAVIYEGFNQKLFKPIKGDTLVDSLRQYGLRIGKYFLFVGTVQPRKNLERLIKAFAVHPQGGLKLVIAGSKGWLSDEIYKLPKQLGIEDRVKFLGYVPDKDLPALYSRAIALTFPSLFEGFGLPILEAQACGCPVLTSKTSSMPEVAGKGALLVDPCSEDDIVEGMVKIQSSKIKNQNVKAGFENIKRFSWEKSASQTLEVLESLR